MQHSTDHDYLTPQIEGTLETFNAVMDAVHAGKPYDDGSGLGQDPMTRLHCEPMPIAPPGDPAGTSAARVHITSS